MHNLEVSLSKKQNLLIEFRWYILTSSGKEGAFEKAKMALNSEKAEKAN